MKHLRMGLVLVLMTAACGSRQQGNAGAAGNPGDQEAARSAGPSDTERQPDRGPGRNIPQQTVFFGPDSAELSAEGRAALDEQVAWMTENPRREIVVHGYASDEGSATYNLTLANNRAHAIREYLVDQGVPVGRISVVSHGEQGREADPSVERRAVFASDRDSRPDEATTRRP